MKNNKLATTKPAASTQRFLDIAEIRDNLMMMRDGTLRAVILVSSINFALKGEDEQNAIIQAYVSFLNSFTFPVQIVVQSRRLNIDHYMEKLSRLEKEQTNELLRMQIADYRDFLKELLDLGEIMTKKFYVVVPFFGIEKTKKGFFSRLMETLSAAPNIKMSQKHFMQYENEIKKRVDSVRSGLSSIGLATIQLETQSLIELFYNTYNPELAESEKLVDISKLQMAE